MNTVFDLWVASSRWCAFAALALTSAVAWATDAYEPDDSPVLAVAISPAEAHLGKSIAPANDIDWVTFSVPGASKVVVKAEHDFVFNGDALVRLYDANQIEIASGLGTAVAFVDEGVHFASVEDQGHDAVIEDYTVRLTLMSAEPDLYEDDDSSDSATALLLGESQAAHTVAPAGDQDWYTFTLTEELPVTVDTVSAMGALKVTLLNDQLEELFSGGTRLTPDLPAGTYFVRVEAQQGTDVSAAYTINLWRRDGPDPYEDDDEPSRASWIGNSGPKQTHNFHDAGDTDWVRFFAEAGMGIDVIIDVLGVDAAPEVALFREDGVTLIAQGAGSLSWDADTTGFYLVRVTNGAPSAFGADTVYTIGVPLHPPGIVPGSLVGVVLDSVSNGPVAHAVLRITNFGNLSTRSDSRGVYVFPALPAGTYTAHASAIGYLDGLPGVARVGSGSTTLNFVLDPEPSVPGDVDGNGVVNALDIQLVVNKVLGADIGDRNADINGDSLVNALDVQLVVNAVLGLGK